MTQCFSFVVLVVWWWVWYNERMKNPYKDSELMQVLSNNPEFTLSDAISYLNERYDDAYDPQAEREHWDMLEELEMESHIEHIRSQGGDYWRNDAGEWCCG